MRNLISSRATRTKDTQIETESEIEFMTKEMEIAEKSGVKVI